jgi:hypothetical protein
VGQSGSRLPELKRRVQSDGADEQIGPAVPILPDYRRIAVPLLYQAGISVIGFLLSFHVLAISLLLRDPKLMERIRAIMMGKSGAWADRFGHQVPGSAASGDARSGALDRSYAYGGYSDLLGMLAGGILGCLSASSGALALAVSNSHTCFSCCSRGCRLRA